MVGIDPGHINEVQTKPLTQPQTLHLFHHFHAIAWNTLSLTYVGIGQFVSS